MLEPSPVNIFLWDNFTHLDFLISFGTNVKTSQLKEVSVYVLIALIYCVFKNTEPGLPMHLCLDVKHPFPESLSLGKSFGAPYVSSNMKSGHSIFPQKTGHFLLGFDWL